MRVDALRKLPAPAALVTITAACAVEARPDSGAVADATPRKEVIQPEGVTRLPVFSSGVRSGDLIFLSGAIGALPGVEPPTLVEGGIGPEARQAMDNLGAVLEAAEAGWDDVVKCTVFLADMADFAAFNEVYAGYFTGDPPARSALAAAGLAFDARVEVECIAAAPTRTARPPVDRSVPTVQEAQQHNVLTAEEEAAGWRLLFDGGTLEGWRRYDGGEMTDGWRVEDGDLVHVGGGFDIIHEEPFADFELSLEWMVEPGGNSGIFYRAALGEDDIFNTAPEMQVLDNAGHADGRNPLTSAGANYALHAPSADFTNPAGEWNSVGITVAGNSVEHRMNGELIVSYELGSPEWRDLVENSKFAEWPRYGKAASGHIGLQDHGDVVRYRNIKVKELR